MGRFAGLVLAAVMILSGVAHADGRRTVKLARWDGVMALQPGMEVDVLARNEAGAERCVVSSANDSALTCLREYPARDTRLVFPRAAVREVRVWEVARGWGTASWVKLALGLAGVGLGVACIVANPLCLLPVLVVAMVVAEGPDLGPYPRPAPPERMHWRLIYRGSTP